MVICGCYDYGGGYYDETKEAEEGLGVGGAGDDGVVVVVGGLEGGGPGPEDELEVAGVGVEHGEDGLERGVAGVGGLGGAAEGVVAEEEEDESDGDKDKDNYEFRITNYELWCGFATRIGWWGVW